MSPRSPLALFMALPAAGLEAAFLSKYGFVQRVMSPFRLREPSVLELEEVKR